MYMYIAEVHVHVYIVIEEEKKGRSSIMKVPAYKGNLYEGLRTRVG